MAAWDLGPFDNDGAMDLVADISDGEFDDLDDVLDVSDYIDSDQGEMIIALAHLAAGHFPADQDELTADHVSFLKSPDIRAKLRTALEAVLSTSERSELVELWEESDELEEWKAASHVELAG
ncbi:DUF4259 domain-containing protein [Devriesea agamarum]|uniref:DUF4259 domain-containing protein n=1 Tax=Devriesea agamarum TaxID=472569 RepID=UPI00071C6054|nr:DUF4259 domain-containing protein [Devriesea agamarum]